MLYLLNNIEIQNKLLHLRYGCVGWIICWSARGHFFIDSSVFSVQAVSHIWTRCPFRPTFAHVSWESDFRRFYNQTNVTRDKRSEIVFAFCFDCRAACSSFDIWTRNEVSRVFVQYYGLIISSNFFSFLQSKNYHKLFLQVFQMKGTILRKQNKKGLVLWHFLTFSFSHATGRTLTTENMLRHALWKVKENGFVKKQFKLIRCFVYCLLFIVLFAKKLYKSNEI